MRKIQFDSIKESQEGGFDRLEAGNYSCLITGMEDVEEREYVRMLLDVAEGPRAGYFSDKFYADKPWAHSVVLSYKDTALKMLKGRLHVIADCNPGFDPEAAWNAGQLSMFLGKGVGVCFNEEEYESNDGTTRVGVKPGALVRLSAIQDGTAKPPRRKTLDGEWVDLAEARREDEYRKRRSASATTTAAGTYAGDIPFD